MATQKKGLIYRLTMGKDDNPDFTPDKLPSNRWQLFKDILSQRMGLLFKLNLMMVGFCLPAVAVYLIFIYFANLRVGLAVPYSSSLGVGYGAYYAAEAMGNAQYFNNQIIFWSLMIPCLMIASLGFAGAFHTMKLLVWGEGVSLAQTFFNGIKNNFLTYLVLSFVVGLFLLVSAFNLNAHLMLGGQSWITIMGSIASIIALVLVLFVSLYMTTQAVTYKIKFFGMLKNSLILTVAKIFRNIFFVGLSALPVIIILIFPSFGSIVGFYFLVLGMSITVLIWTIYAQYVFDLYLNDKIEGAIKDRGIYKQKVERDKKEIEAVKKYSNPKKRKKIKSIDEGKSFTPLAESFSRADLERMRTEKQALIEEIEKEREQSELDDEEQAVDGDIDATSADVESDGDFDTSELEALEGLSKEDIDALKRDEE